MPNPRVTFRCPEDIYQQLPADERERSRLLLQLLNEHFNPRTPEDKLAQLEYQITMHNGIINELAQQVMNLEKRLPHLIPDGIRDLGTSRDR